jgi:NAD(P)-dependent dehydrogenase (short-subunit alcohol dehydrogenase family)
LAADLAPMDIRINAVCPGDQHRDPLARHRRAGLAHSAALGSPTDVAGVIF